MSNLRMGLRGKLAKSIDWSTCTLLDSDFPVDKVIHSLNNWGQCKKTVD